MRCVVAGSAETTKGLALEASGEHLPPHACRTLLRAESATSAVGEYFFAPGTQTLLLTGHARAGEVVLVRDVEVVEVGSHEARGRVGLATLGARLGDEKRLRRDVAVLGECVRRGDWRRVVRGLRRQGLAELGLDGYAQWVARYDTLTADDVAAMQARAQTLAAPTKFSVVVPCFDTPEPLLRACIDSVVRQIYPHWELCLANDASRAPHVAQVLDEAARRDPRIRVVHRGENGHISAASNDAIALARHPWLVLLDHDDELAPHALQLVAEAIAQNPDAGVVYSDEDKLDLQGRRCEPYFKPAFNPDLLRAQNYISHLGVYRKDLVEAVGGFRTAFNGSQDYDLVLRVTEKLQPHQVVHVPHVLYHWRMTPGSTALGVESKPYAYVAGELALREHLARTGQHASVRPSQYAGQYHVKYAVPQPAPKVSIIVPTRDNPDVLDRCVESLRTTTHYANYELVLIDNDSAQPRALKHLASLAQKPNVRLLRYPHPFNYAAINNWAVAQTDATVVVLLNDDVEVLHVDWLDELVSQAMRPEVGAVGAKLLYPNRTVQHAGVVLGIGGIAAHAFCRQGEHDPAYFARPLLTHNVSAVTGATLAIQRTRYLEIGGMNERLAVAYNDVDLCLRLHQAGYDNVFTPHARLVHHESASRGKDKLQDERFAGEWRWMARTWESYVAADPCYSPNLTVEREDYSIAFPPRHARRYALRPQFVRKARPSASTVAAHEADRPAVATSHKTWPNGKQRRRKMRGKKQGVEGGVPSSAN